MERRKFQLGRKNVLQLQLGCKNVLQPKSCLSCSEKPTTGPCHEPNHLSSCLLMIYIRYRKIFINIVIPYQNICDLYIENHHKLDQWRTKNRTEDLYTLSMTPIFLLLRLPLQMLPIYKEIINSNTLQQLYAYIIISIRDILVIY